MKELSIKDKANRYDKAIEIAKSKIKNDKDHVLYEGDVIDIFPELKESEDEVIRKAIIEHFAGSHSSMFPYRGFTKEQILAWLEKQSEQNHAEWHIEDEQNFNACLGYIPDEFLKRWLKDIIHIKYDKPIDKVESKFKVGDWVVYCGKTREITGLHNGVFTITNQDGSYFFNQVESTTEPAFRLWTIEDAKDGDVLRLGCVIAIFKSIFKNSIGNPKCVCYCSFYKNRGFEIPIENEEDNVYGCTNTTPATQEERDLLFQKMKEDGYEWNKDKKKLIKL